MIIGQQHVTDTSGISRDGSVSSVHRQGSQERRGSQGSTTDVADPNYRLVIQRQDSMTAREGPTGTIDPNRSVTQREGSTDSIDPNLRFVTQRRDSVTMREGSSGVIDPQRRDSLTIVTQRQGSTDSIDPNLRSLTQRRDSVTMREGSSGVIDPQRRDSLTMKEGSSHRGVARQRSDASVHRVDSRHKKKKEGSRGPSDYSSTTLVTDVARASSPSSSHAPGVLVEDTFSSQPPSTEELFNVKRAASPPSRLPSCTSQQLSYQVIEPVPRAGSPPSRLPSVTSQAPSLEAIVPQIPRAGSPPSRLPSCTSRRPSTDSIGDIQRTETPTSFHTPETSERPNFEPHQPSAASVKSMARAGSPPSYEVSRTTTSAVSIQSVPRSRSPPSYEVSRTTTTKTPSSQHMQAPKVPSGTSQQPSTASVHSVPRGSSPPSNVSVVVKADSLPPKSSGSGPKASGSGTKRSGSGPKAKDSKLLDSGSAHKKQSHYSSPASSQASTLIRADSFGKLSTPDAKHVHISLLFSIQFNRILL